MGLGDTVVVLVVSPASATMLSRLAAQVAVIDQGLVVPLSVAGFGADTEHVAVAEGVLRQAEQAAREVGARAEGRLVRHGSIAQAVIDTVTRSAATLTVMGWQGMTAASGAHAGSVVTEPPRAGIFGQLVGSIVGEARVPLAVIRPSDQPFDRILLPVTEEALDEHGSHPTTLAAELVQRFARGSGAPVTLLRSGLAAGPLPEHVLRLSDRVHHDPRRLDRALAAASRREDLVVVPVHATAAGLRAATTRVAWASPDAWLMLVVDAARGTEGDLAAAVALAGTPPPERFAEAAGRHEVVVTVGCREDAPSSEELLAVLAMAGSVTDLSTWNDRRGRGWRQAVLDVDGRSAGEAVGSVMELLARSGPFAQADVTYEVERRRAPW